MPTGIFCPRLGCNGELIERRTKKGRIFYGCSNFKDTGCDYAVWNKPIKEKCPQCDASFLVAMGRGKKAKFKCVAEGCSYSRAVE